MHDPAHRVLAARGLARRLRTTRTRLLALVAALALLVVACGGDDGGGDTAGGEGGGEGVAAEVDLSGAEVTVGSKEFTEQLILGQMAVQALEAAGASVTDQTGLQGTQVVRQALTSGEVDMYWEYTGTGWITILQNTEPVQGAEEQFQAVAEADLEQNDVQWFARAPMNNTYAIAKGPDGPDVTALSELSGFFEENPDAASICAATEFLTRDDGLPGLERAYEFEFDEVSEIELGLIYSSIGDECTFGEVFQTDGRIPANDLELLEDDEGFFPVYNAAATMRNEVYQENAEAYDTLFEAIAEGLDNETMRDLNARVDDEGETPEDVARDYLVEQGIIGG